MAVAYLGSWFQFMVPWLLLAPEWGRTSRRKHASEGCCSSQGDQEAKREKSRTESQYPLGEHISNDLLSPNQSHFLNFPSAFKSTIHSEARFQHGNFQAGIFWVQIITVTDRNIYRSCKSIVNDTLL